MKKIILLCIILSTALAGCAGSASRTNQLNLGMTKSEAINVMGDPSSVSATNGVEYLTYKLTQDTNATNTAGCAALGLITFGIIFAQKDGDCSGGVRTDYFLQFRDGRLISYGKVGDFDSTKNPTLNLNINNR